jgi:hypothetical protein
MPEIAQGPRPRSSNILATLLARLLAAESLWGAEGEDSRGWSRLSSPQMWIKIRPRQQTESAASSNGIANNLELVGVAIATPTAIVRYERAHGA